MTLAGSKKTFLATKFLLFDFELFIGGQRQKQRAGDPLKLPALLNLVFHSPIFMGSLRDCKYGCRQLGRRRNVTPVQLPSIL